jgi:DNA invertase Pin-like site-specific DNA recombinase
MATARIGIYARLSEDRDGQQTATARQIADCEGYAARRDWEVADTFEDVDTSAFIKKSKRPEFERMLGALRAGDIDGVVVWKLDRLTRQQRDLVRVMEACESHDSFVASVMESIDTREPHGQFVAELLTAQGRMESANSSLRQKRKHDELARLGVPMTGGTRTFGYTKDMRSIVPEEAALIQEAVSLLFAGESMRGICRDWQQRGVVASSGKPWQPTPLRRLLMSSTIAALRERNGERLPGNWPAIVDAETSRRLKELLGDPARRLSPGSARRYLLAGFLVCGECGEKLLSRPRVDHVRRYICCKRPGHRSCGGVAILAEPVEELILEMVLAVVDHGALVEAVSGRGVQDDALAELIRRDTETLDQLARDFYGEQLLTREEFFAARKVVASRLETNRAKQARRDGQQVLSGYLGDSGRLRSAWDRGSLEWRRAVIGAVMDHITVSRGLKGRNLFDPTRVKPVWRY